jgi:type 1 fimbria pilin
MQLINLSSALLFSVSLGLSQIALANSGNIQFSGNIVDYSCSAQSKENHCTNLGDLIAKAKVKPTLSINDLQKTKDVAQIKIEDTQKQQNKVLIVNYL